MDSCRYKIELSVVLTNKTLVGNGCSKSLLQSARSLVRFPIQNRANYKLALADVSKGGILVRTKPTSKRSISCSTEFKLYIVLILSQQFSSSLSFSPQPWCRKDCCQNPENTPALTCFAASCPNSAIDNCN